MLDPKDPKPTTENPAQNPNPPLVIPDVTQTDRSSLNEGLEPPQQLQDSE